MPEATTTSTSGGKITHPTEKERIARGKVERKKIPRGEHAGWTPATDRRNPLDILQEQAADRVPDLIPIRYGRMAATPFAFYRGAAAIMAADLATMPKSSIHVQLTGDAHLSNFGGFAAPDRALVFDINDFDETLPGPWDWDLKRLAASFVIAARERGFSKKYRDGLVMDAARSYRESMRTFAPMHNLEVWYARLDLSKEIDDLRRQLKSADVKRLDAGMEKASRKNNIRAFSKLTEIRDGRRRIVSDPPLVVPIDQVFSAEESHDLEERLLGVLRRYRRTLPNDRRHLLEEYRLVDVARKVVGVGSVGTRAWIALMLGVNDEDPLFLQFKEAQTSVLAPYVGKSRFANQGQRVVEGQRLIQAASDIFLGWDRIEGVDGIERDFYVRQLWDGKVSPDMEVMSPEAMPLFARICGWTLARSHARSGDRVAIAAYLGRSQVFDQAIVEFAEAYADQNEHDHKALVDAIASGKIQAESGI